MANGTKGAYLKCIAALLLFGSNGIVASHIGLSSYEIIFTRTLIGSLLLILIFLLTRQKAQFWQHRRDFRFLVISGVAMGASWREVSHDFRDDTANADVSTGARRMG